ncbi:MAG: flagellin, partial [Betaproteobacteria bacterium]
MSSINTNLISLNAQRNLKTSQGDLATSIKRLSSGLRVNTARDDAAGLAIAERMNTQVRGMNVALRNSNDAISLAQVAEGALGKTGDIFQRMRELAVQAANGTNNSDDLVSLNREFVQMAQEATRTLGGTQFNGVTILASTGSNNFQIGANNNSSIDRLSFDNYNWAGTTNITAVTGTAVISGTETPTMQITTQANAQSAIASIDTALNEINSQRATWGSRQNRFENVVSNLMSAVENQTAARGRI